MCCTHAHTTLCSRQISRIQMNSLKMSKEEGPPSVEKLNFYRKNNGKHAYDNLFFMYQLKGTKPKKDKFYYACMKHYCMVKVSSCSGSDCGSDCGRGSGRYH